MLKESQLFLERYDLLKSLRRWKLLFAVLAGITLYLLIGGKSIGLSKLNEPHIARISIHGFIDVNHEKIKKIAKIKSDKNIKAVILEINSGGGTVVGGESFYHAIKSLAKEKPVVSFFGNQATSAAYMIALGSTYIISPEGAITGSIGVISQSAEFTELAKKIGVKPIIFKSSSLKAVPNIAEKLSPNGADVIESVVDDIFDFFIGLVIENRDSLNEEQIAEISTGKIFSGRQALQVGLVDQLGNFAQVKEWLRTELNNKDLKILKYNLEPKRRPDLMEIFYSFVGLEPQGQHSGLLSYWNQNLIVNN